MKTIEYETEYTRKKIHCQKRNQIIANYKNNYIALVIGHVQNKTKPFKLL
jgi:hypothetical protein